MRMICFFTVILTIIPILPVFPDRRPVIYGITAVEDVPVDEHPTVDRLAAHFTVICRGGSEGYGWGFCQTVEYLKRQRPPRRMFHRAMRCVVERCEKDWLSGGASQTETDKNARRIGRALRVLAVCADSKDRRLFRKCYMNPVNLEYLRASAFFAHLVSVPDDDIPFVIKTVSNPALFSWEDRAWMYKEIGAAYSFAPPDRRSLYAAPFRDVAWKESHIYNFIKCDNLMKAFDPEYAKSEERIRLIDHFRTSPQQEGVNREGWLPTLDKALDECTNQTVKVEAPWFVFLDAYPPFVSYEESILGEKPNPYRTAIRIAAGSVCVIGLFAGMWVWMRRKRMGRSDPFPHFE